MRTMRIASLCLFAALAAGANVSAQFFNRAAYLGPSEEGVRRNFNQREEYMLDRWAIVNPGPWYKTHQGFGRPGMRWAAGSTSARDFTFEGDLLFENELDEEFTVRAHVLQSENQDTRYLRNAIELDYSVAQAASMFVFFEGIADKSQDDLSVGTYFRPTESSGVRVQWTLVDFVGDKSLTTKYEREAHAFMVSGYAGDQEESHFEFELAAQLPMRIRFTETQRTLALQRYMGRVAGRVPLTERDWLILGCDFEYTSKRNRPLDAADPEREDLHRRMDVWQAEWWRRLEGGRELALSAMYVRKSEDGRRPSDRNSDYRQRRQEIFGAARMRLPVSEKFRLEPRLIGGYVRYDERGITDPLPMRRFRGFQGRVGIPIVYRFSERSVITATWDIQLDELASAGGAIVFQSEL